MIPNYLEGEFAATEPNQVCCGNVTYLWMGKRWAYLAVVLYVLLESHLHNGSPGLIKSNEAWRYLDAFESQASHAINQQVCIDIRFDLFH